MPSALAKRQYGSKFVEFMLQITTPRRSSSTPLAFLKIQLANTCGFLLQESIPKNIHYLSHKYHWKPVMTS